jgi:hypothetical protein
MELFAKSEKNNNQKTNKNKIVADDVLETETEKLLISKRKFYETKKQDEENMKKVVEQRDNYAKKAYIEELEKKKLHDGFQKAVKLLNDTKKTNDNYKKIEKFDITKTQKVIEKPSDFDKDIEEKIKKDENVIKKMKELEEYINNSLGI